MNAAAATVKLGRLMSGIRFRLGARVNEELSAPSAADKAGVKFDTPGHRTGTPAEHSTSFCSGLVPFRDDAGDEAASCRPNL